MIKVIILFILGFVCLIEGGRIFVDNSVKIAHTFRVPEFKSQVFFYNIVDVYPELEERIAYKDIKKVKENENLSKLSKL